MEERRRNRRTNMPEKLKIRKLGSSLHENEVEVQVLDVSKTGIGFSCSKVLQIGEVYEAFMPIWTREVLHAFMQIVRIELRGDSYNYGALFIGMPEIDLARIEVFQTVNENRK